jgi:hypothetical protein
MEMEMKQIITVVAACLLLVVALVAARNVITGDFVPAAGDGRIGQASQDSQVNAKPGDVANVKDGVQEVTLRMEGWKYIMEPATLQKGIPVKMTVDLKTVTGCMTDIVIPSFNVRKVVRQGDNVIEFTPDKTGDFRMACSMNMGKGTFSVVEPDGTKSSFVEAASAPSGGGCGLAAGGGCGCGGAAV